MPQHRSSRRRVVISGLKHKNAANQMLDVLEELTANIAATTAKVTADAQNVVLTGSIDPTASVNVVGVGTLFTTELQVGDSILVSGETRVVATIVDDTNLTVTVAFSDNLNDTSPEKVAAWDKDYVTAQGVVAVDMDAESIGQHKASLRKMLIDKMAHKRLGNEIADALEEGQVTLNLILAQMDADAGTLSNDATYEAFKIASPISGDSTGSGPSKVTLRQAMIKAFKHTQFGNSLTDEIVAVHADLNDLIDLIKTKNA